jgi:hypothetical protein
MPVPDTSDKGINDLANALAKAFSGMTGMMEDTLTRLTSQADPGSSGPAPIRAAQDRAIEDGGRLFAQAAAWPALCAYPLAAPPRGSGDRGRTATIELRAGRVCIKRPRNGFDRNDPTELTLTLVDAVETNPPAAPRRSIGGC